MCLPGGGDGGCCCGGDGGGDARRYACDGRRPPRVHFKRARARARDSHAVRPFFDSLSWPKNSHLSALQPRLQVDLKLQHGRARARASAKRAQAACAKSRLPPSNAGGGDNCERVRRLRSGAAAAGGAHTILLTLRVIQNEIWPRARFQLRRLRSVHFAISDAKKNA